MCGIVGIFGHPEASKLTYLGLYALQHRGQESAGIVSSDGERLHAHREMGHVSEIFGEGVLNALPGDTAIGHVRYSTYGSSELKNAQPFVVEYGGGGSRSPTTATSSTPPSFGGNSSGAGRSSNRAWTPR